MKTKIVKYVDYSEYAYRIKLHPTEEQKFELWKVSQATNKMFLELLLAAECYMDKYRGKCRPLMADTYWLAGIVTKERNSDYLLKKYFWSSSQTAIITKVKQRAYERAASMIDFDSTYRKSIYSAGKTKWVKFKRMSECYEDPEETDISDDFQIPIKLNSAILKCSNFPMKKGDVKKGQGCAIVKTKKKNRLICPRMYSEGIEMSTFRASKLPDPNYMNHGYYAYIIHKNGNYYLAFYHRDYSARMPDTGMPKYVKENYRKHILSDRECAICLKDSDYMMLDEPIELKPKDKKKRGRKKKEKKSEIEVIELCPTKKWMVDYGT